MTPRPGHFIPGSDPEPVVKETRSDRQKYVLNISVLHGSSYLNNVTAHYKKCLQWGTRCGKLQETQTCRILEKYMYGILLGKCKLLGKHWNVQMTTDCMEKHAVKGNWGDKQAVRGDWGDKHAVRGDWGNKQSVRVTEDINILLWGDWGDKSGDRVDWVDKHVVRGTEDINILLGELDR